MTQHGGTGNVATLLQANASGSGIYLGQVGNVNKANLIQNNAPASTMTVAQTGDYNQITATQAANLSNILSTQTGNSNSATIRQR